MEMNRNNTKTWEEANRILLDLLFNLTAGDSVEKDWTYEQQLEYFARIIIPERVFMSDLIEYGQKYKTASRYMFPGKPEKIKNKVWLIKLFASFVLLKEIFDCNDYSFVSDPEKIKEKIFSQFELEDYEKEIFEKEVSYLAKKYSEISQDEYESFLNIAENVAEAFHTTYSKVIIFVMGEDISIPKDSFETLLASYNIPASERIKFHLEVDALIETVVIKNRHLEYMNEFKAEWERHFPKLKYNKEIEKYIKDKKQHYVAVYGNNINSIRSENFLFVMLADITVKLALAEGAKNLHELTQKIKDMTRELGNNIRDAFIDIRKNVIYGYGLALKMEYPEEFGQVLIPYRTDLLYLRDIVIEEISFRNAGNIVQRQSRKTKDASEYELLLSRKDAEIYELKRELEYYENIKQQEFKAEISQYNKALTDLFRKMCDFKYNSPLNELYLLANGSQDIDTENVKGVLQNLMFILSTMHIVPYETGNVGKKVKFYDDEANIVYAVDDAKVKEGLNQGVQVYPGWKYKDAELVLPRVDI